MGVLGLSHRTAALRASALGFRANPPGPQVPRPCSAGVWSWDPKMPRATQRCPDRALLSAPPPAATTLEKVGGSQHGRRALHPLSSGSLRRPGTPTRHVVAEVSPGVATLHKTALQPKPIWKIPGTRQSTEAGAGPGAGRRSRRTGGHRGESFNGGGRRGGAPPARHRGGWGRGNTGVGFKNAAGLTARLQGHPGWGAPAGPPPTASAPSSVLHLRLCPQPGGRGTQGGRTGFGVIAGHTEVLGARKAGRAPRGRIWVRVRVGGLQGQWQLWGRGPAQRGRGVDEGRGRRWGWAGLGWTWSPENPLQPPAG